MIDFEKFEPFSKYTGWYLERSSSEENKFNWQIQRKIHEASLVVIKISDNQYKVVKFRLYNFAQAERLISRKELLALKLQTFMFVTGIRLTRMV